MKICTKCGEEKPATFEYFYRNKNGKGGLQSWCKGCAKQYDRRPARSEKRRKYKREHRRSEGVKTYQKEYNRSEKGREVARKVRLKAVHGVTLKDYSCMLEGQDGVCAICGGPKTAKRNNEVKRLAIGHDHETGLIRGLLCSNCNRGLGMFGDSEERLLQAALYLERSRNSEG